MEVYRRIVERVRGALWAHHRRLMPERQFHRILAYVYHNKYEYQIRLDQMQMVGREYDGRVEVVTTPSGHLLTVRTHPCVQQLTSHQQHQLIMSAYAKACEEGRRLMSEAELRVYKQFLKDLKPLVMGIRDNPEFFTVAGSAMETSGGVLKGEEAGKPQRTIPAAKARTPAQAAQERRRWERSWQESRLGAMWARTLKGKEYLSRFSPEHRPRGAPGAKTSAIPLDVNAAYTRMDEERLRQRNWVAFLDNKHVAEALWTKTRVADREKQLQRRREVGEAWHRPVRSF